MSYVQDFMDEMKAGAPAEAPVETQEQPTETQTEETQVQETTTEEAPAEETQVEDKPAEEQQEETQVEDKPAEETQVESKPAKPDFTKLTKEEKAEHAFQRQLAKQKSKYEQSLADMQTNFTSQIADLKKQIQDSKPAPKLKTREDFPLDEGGDDEYIKYLAEQKVEKIMADRDAKQKEEEAQKAKEQAALDEAKRQQDELSRQFNEYAKQTFTTDESYKAFTDLVNKAVDRGMGEVLDKAPAVRDFLFSEPSGPMILNEMLNNKDAFVRVMSSAKNPMKCYLEMHDMEKELVARAAEQTQQQQQTHKMPSIGKPGAGASTATAPDMWHDDASLIDFVRRHK